MILISATPSPFARKVRIALLEKKLVFETRNEVPWHEDSQTGLYNPLEQLPILLVPGEEPLFDSTYILDWLERRYPTPPLRPLSPVAALEAKRVQVIAEGVMNATVQLFWEVQRREMSVEWATRQLRKVRNGLAYLDQKVSGRRYVVGGAFSHADIAIISMLGMQDMVVESGAITAWQGLDPTVEHWAKLHAYLRGYEAYHRARPSVRATAPFMFDLTEKIV